MAPTGKRNCGRPLRLVYEVWHGHKLCARSRVFTVGDEPRAILRLLHKTFPAGLGYVLEAREA